MQSTLQIQYEGDLNTTIFDLTGRKILNTQLKSIDMSTIAAGTYIVKALESKTNQENSFKIVKK